MNTKQIQKYVMRYLEARSCAIIEKMPYQVTVKLSPQADKELTNRPYYWGFVERTGVPPETMTFTFVWDPASALAAEAKAEDKEPVEPSSDAQGKGAIVNVNTIGSGSSTTGESLLSRITSYAPTSMNVRIPKDPVTFGSRRLQQIFQAVQLNGRFARLFEETSASKINVPQSMPYESWLCVNYNVELASDRKRNELHSLSIQLATGEIKENFHTHLQSKKLSPRLPAGIHLIKDTLTLYKAGTLLESYLEKKIKLYDTTWASEANRRLEEELQRLHAYYGPMLETEDNDFKEGMQAQYDHRCEEIDWQYRPRIKARAVNCGIFHLKSE